MTKKRAPKSREAVPADLAAQTAPLSPITSQPLPSEADNWLTIALEEYKTLRAESLASVQHLHAIIGYSLTAMGVLFGFAMKALGGDLGDLFLSVAIPVFALTSLHVWATEFTRMVRAGRYLQEIEKRVVHPFMVDSRSEAQPSRAGPSLSNSGRSARQPSRVCASAAGHRLLSG